MDQQIRIRIINNVKCRYAIWRYMLNLYDQVSAQNETQ